MSAVVSHIREPLVQGGKTYHQITEDLVSATERTPSTAWVIAFLVSVTGLALFVFSVAWTIWEGIGSWDLNRTIGRSWDITKYVR